jgi:hypothetical protein
MGGLLRELNRFSKRVRRKYLKVRPHYDGWLKAKRVYVTNARDSVALDNTPQGIATSRESG